MTDADLDRVDRAIINAFQGGFPITRRPFESAAAALRAADVDTTGVDVLERIRRLVDGGTISRFGPLIDANAIGGTTMLVAMAVPPERFETVAETVNAHPAVAHNYERDHELNMWFVLSVETASGVDRTLQRIESKTGLNTVPLPTLREFHLGAFFPVDGPVADGNIDLSPTGATNDSINIGNAKRDLLTHVADGLPLTRDPYATVASDLDVADDWVRNTLASLLGAGFVRRIGVIPNHYAIGYTENAMTVWDVPDPAVKSVGEAVSELEFVTHCYCRPRYGDRWPYNLFAMVHGRSEPEVQQRIKAVHRSVERHCDLGSADRDVLYSKRILKKRGIRFGDHDSESGRSN